jgi:hypothetical protein
MGAMVRGMFRTQHPENGIQKGLRRREAYGTTIAISLFTLMMMIYMP